MHLVEAEDVGPIEGDAPAVTPPRPPHRRVSVSLVFTLSVLTGLVVAIYTLLPLRHDEIITVALREHRASASAWDLTSPTPAELRAWTIGVVGKDVPALADGMTILGARRIEIVHRPAALVRAQIHGEPVTLVIQHSRGIAPERIERDEGDLRALSWRRERFRFVAVGSSTTAATWSAAVQR